MNSDSRLGLIELVLVLGVVVGWAVLEIARLKMDEKRLPKVDGAAEREGEADETG